MRGWFEINLVAGGGWSPGTLEKMSLEEFVGWYSIAHEVNDQQQKELAQR